MMSWCSSIVRLSSKTRYIDVPLSLILQYIAVRTLPHSGQSHYQRLLVYSHDNIASASGVCYPIPKGEMGRKR